MTKSNIIEFTKRSLPQALSSSEDYAELNSVQRENLIARLRYIEEVPLKIQEWIDSGGINYETKNFIDRIELDLMINLGSIASPKSSVSPWLLHSSWTFNSSSSVMRESVSGLLRNIQQHHFDASSTPEEFTEILSVLSVNLSSLLDGFYAAQTFDSALGHLIAVDLCMSKLYSGFIAQRLNPNVLS